MNVDLKIVQRVSREGLPFTELLFQWTERGVTRHACSRLNYLISNNVGTRNQQIAAFEKRREKWQ